MKTKSVVQISAIGGDVLLVKLHQQSLLMNLMKTQKKTNRKKRLLNKLHLVVISQVIN